MENQKDVDGTTENAKNYESIVREMPKYQSHKVVHALRIKQILLDSDTAKEKNRETDGSAIIVPFEEGYGGISVNSEYIIKHQPQVGGYYVVYVDGYTSFSPAKAFEEGNTLIVPETFMTRLLAEETQLNERKAKLSSFIESGSFGNISQEQQGLLQEQLVAMTTYSEILNKRIVQINNSSVVVQ